MTGHDPLETVRTGVDALRRGTTIAAPPPPAAKRTERSATNRGDSDNGEDPGTAQGSDTADPGPGTGRADGPDTGVAGATLEDAGVTARDRDSGAARTTERRTAQRPSARHTPTKDTSSKPSQRTPTSTPVDESRGAAASRKATRGQGSDTADGSVDLPGFARGARRQIGVGLTERTFNQLREARSNEASNGDVVLEALRRTHTELVEEFSPGTADEGDLFAVEPRRKRRLGIEGVRRMEFMCSPAEAGVIGELAQRCDLSLSALIEEALTRHLARRPPRSDAGTTVEASPAHSSGAQHDNH